MSKLGPIEKARAVFDTYAGMAEGELPDNPLSALQVRLFRWQSKNFGWQPLEVPLAGATEEVGEIWRAWLKSRQKIRGYGNYEKMRADIGDGVADVTIFLMQACTNLRLDFYTLVTETALQEVLERDWTKNPEEGKAQEK